ncbi:MAG: polysaccharide lyase [Rhizobiaceae bacterium]|nr:polysaccharide lyase [Rhizobiaceae bacterium]
MNLRVSSFGGPSAGIDGSENRRSSPAQKVLRDRLDGPSFSDDGGLYYRDNYEQSAGVVAFQNNVTYNGGGALKLSVRPLGGSVDQNESERAEIWEKTELRVPYDQGVWYGFAVRFADPVPTDDHRYLIAQWKREIDPGAEGDFSPFFAIRMRNGKLFATVETNYIEEPAPVMMKAVQDHEVGIPVWLRPKTNQMRALVATDPNWLPDDGDLFHARSDAIQVVDHGNRLPTPDSGWIDFAVYTQPGPDGSGRIELYANARPIVTVTGHIGHADRGLGDKQYFKFGPYRAPHDREWSLYYADFRRSPERADVLGNVESAVLPTDSN